LDLTSHKTSRPDSEHASNRLITQDYHLLHDEGCNVESILTQTIQAGAYREKEAAAGAGIRDEMHRPPSPWGWPRAL